MAANQTDTQKYIDKFCSYLDELLEAYETEPDEKFLHQKVASRAIFLGAKLRLVEGDYYCKELFGPQGWYHYNLERVSHTKSVYERDYKAYEEREKRIREFQIKARALNERSLPLKAKSPVDHIKLAENVKAFCKHLDEIIEIYDIGEQNAEIHRFGRKANRLAVKIGLVCQDRELALKCGIPRSEGKLPYVEGQWKNGAWTLYRHIGGDSTLVKRLESWKKRAKKLLRKEKSINPRTKGKLQREVEIALILEKDPNIKIQDLAERLNVSKSTISRSKVWRQFKKRPPLAKFYGMV